MNIEQNMKKNSKNYPNNSILAGNLTITLSSNTTDPYSVRLIGLGNDLRVISGLSVCYKNDLVESNLNGFFSQLTSYLDKGYLNMLYYTCRENYN